VTIPKDAIDLGEFVIQGAIAGGATKGFYDIGSYIRGLKSEPEKVAAMNDIAAQVKSGETPENAVSNYTARLKEAAKARQITPKEGPPLSESVVTKKGDILRGTEGEPTGKTIVSGGREAWETTQG
jgi:hypothetical protein